MIDKLYCDLSNKYENFTHWYWNRKSHHVTCRICGEELDMKIKYVLITILIVAVIVLYTYLFKKLISSDLPIWLKILLFMR